MTSSTTIASRTANPKYKGWTKSQKYERALQLVLRDDWAVRAAAREVGVDRSHLSVRVNERRAEARQLLSAELPEQPVRVENERRRVPTDFWEFEDRYFGHLACMSCKRRHPIPGFHREIIDTVYGPHNRVLINVPPYHGKSTLVTVKSSIFDIAHDPNIQIALVSKSEGLASNFIVQIRNFLSDSRIYEGAKGNLIEEAGPFVPEDPAVNWSQRELYVHRRVSVEKDPTISSWGIDKNIYGTRFHKMIFDDVADADNMRSVERMEWILHSQINNMFLSRVDEGDKVIFIGTPVSAFDMYQELPKMWENLHSVNYPAILNEAEHLTLWPDHFGWDKAVSRRAGMRAQDWNLIYQMVRSPEGFAAFTEEMIDAAKDETRQATELDEGWIVVAGLDPAGAGGKDSGFTAMVVLGFDPETLERHVIDVVNEKGMRYPQLKQTMFDLTEAYNITEWRVENNGLQSQLLQFNDDITVPLRSRGTRVVPHNTGRNKWDPEIGIESLITLFSPTPMITIPWQGPTTHRRMRPLLDQLLSFGMGGLSDCLMAFWEAELGVRDRSKRAHMPLYLDSVHVPARLRRKRMVLSPEDGSARPVSREDQRAGGTMRFGKNRRKRMVLGAFRERGPLPDTPPPPPPKFENV